jgi:uncharacterized protein
MATQTETVKDLLRCMEKGDIAAASSYLHENVTVYEPPALPYGGTWVGHEGFAEFARRFGAAWKTWTVGKALFVDAGTVTIKSNSFEAVARNSGSRVQMEFVELYAFDGAKIIAIRPFYWDTIQVVGALRGGKA